MDNMTVEQFIEFMSQLTVHANDWDYSDAKHTIAASIAWFASRVMGVETENELKDLMMQLHEVIDELSAEKEVKKAMKKAQKASHDNG